MKNISLAILLATTVVSVTGCDKFNFDIYKAKQEVTNNLIDPDSAKFASVYKNPSSGSVCGLVNAKNRMGGYVGNTPFVYNELEGVTMVKEPPTMDDFRRHFDNLEFSKVEDYIEMEGQCKAIKVWESQCGTPIYTVDKACTLINEGKSYSEMLYEFKPWLKNYK